MNKSFTLASLLFIATFTSCKHDKADNGNNNPPTITENTEIKGYNLLGKICGIWNGPITSTTVMGNFAQSPFDFRPISAAQVSQKNELDTANSLFMSFFIVYTGSEYQIAFRNGGLFSGMVRTTYMTLDSVSETSNFSYYRFVDFKKGAARTITEVSFWDDSLHIRAYTNKSNTQPTATVHMDYRAGLQYANAYQTALNAFGFPKKQMVKDFSHSFDSVSESIFYVETQDPYPTSEQPYVGKSTLSYSVAPTINLANDAKVQLIVSVQPLIGQTGAITANLKTISRYVLLTNPQNSFVFDNMHPGSYYLYAFVDNNSNGTIDSGDFISTANTTFSLAVSGTASTSTQINYQIP